MTNRIGRYIGYSSILANSASDHKGIWKPRFQEYFQRKGEWQTISSDEYLYIPFNENSTSHSLFGNYASSLSGSAGGTYNTSTHPYTITDTTYNSGNNTAYRCQAACDVFSISNTNSIFGSLGTSNFCFDMWFNWRGFGNGGGSYGQGAGDYNYGSCGSKTGTSTTNYAIMAQASGDGSINYNFSNNIAGSRSISGLSLNTWYHYMLIRQSGVFYLFLNGELKIVNTSDTSDSIANGGGFAFGTSYRNDSPHYWNVNICDVMFTRDNDCQYAVNNTSAVDIGNTYFTTPKYKNKTMASSSTSKFEKIIAPSNFS